MAYNKSQQYNSTPILGPMLRSATGTPQTSSQPAYQTGTYNYNPTYGQQQQPQQPNGNDGGSGIDGGFAPYNDNRSWYEAYYDNKRNDLKDPKKAFYDYGLGSMPSTYRDIKGFMNWDSNRNAQRDYENQRNVYNTINEGRQQIGQVANDQIGWLRQQDDARNRVLGGIDDAANSQSRTDEYNQLYQGALGQSLAQIQSQYGEARRGQGMDAVRRGVLGGSSDIDANAQINRSQGLATIGAEGSAEQMVRQSMQSDNSQFSALRQSLLAGDPNSLAQLTNQAQGQNDLRMGQTQQYQNQLAQNQLQQQWMNTQSGYLGGALGAAGSSYYNSQAAQAQANQNAAMSNPAYNGMGAGNGSSLYGGSITGTRR